MISLTAVFLPLLGCAASSTSSEHPTDESVISEARGASASTVVINDDAVEQVENDAQAASADPSQGMGNAVAFRFDLTESNRVLLQVETMSSDVKVAEEVAIALATDFAQYATVTDEQGNPRESSTEYGALYDVYDLDIDLYDHEGTFRVTGGKSFDQSTVSWQ